MDTSGEKEKLRSNLRAKRSRLTKAEWQEKSERITQHLIDSEFYKSSHTIHCYVSMNERFEVETRELIQKMITDGKKVVVPVMDFESTTLKHSELKSLDVLKKNTWGVPQPSEFIEIDTSALELVIVPLLAVDLNGNRLGYGKGYYDRFLGKVNVQKLGLVFSEFVLDEIPVEDFDVPLDGYISETGLNIL